MAICDVCGAAEKAQERGARYNETCFDIPDGWRRGANTEMCICPQCVKRLGMTGNNPSRDVSSKADWGVQK